VNPIEFPEVKKWLAGKNERTVKQYLPALEEYVKFTGLNPEQLIDEAEGDRNKSRRYRGAPEGRLQEFHKYLLTSYTRKRAKKEKIGLSEKRAVVFFGAIRTFYERNGFELDVKTPKASPKQVNFKVAIRPKELKRLLEWCSSLRDKTIVLFLFQSGISLAELCSLNYGDVARELEEGKIPLCLHIIREKEKVEYYTFLGKDAVDALKLYIHEREMRGEKLTYMSPLFTNEGTKKLKAQRITSRPIEITFKKLALKSGLVSESQMEAADMNPARPHACRSGFMTTLKLASCNDTAVEYMAGHKLDAVQMAYWGARPEELREMYSKYESYLSISETSAPALGARQAILKEIADIMGMDLELAKSEVRKQLGKEPEESEVESFLKEKIRQKINGERRIKEQRVIVEEDVEKYINDGWTVQSVLHSGKIIVCKLLVDGAPLPNTGVQKGSVPPPERVTPSSSDSEKERSLESNEIRKKTPTVVNSGTTGNVEQTEEEDVDRHRSEPKSKLNNGEQERRARKGQRNLEDFI